MVNDDPLLLRWWDIESQSSSDWLKFFQDWPNPNDQNLQRSDSQALIRSIYGKTWINISIWETAHQPLP